MIDIPEILEIPDIPDLPDIPILTKRTTKRFATVTISSRLQAEYPPTERTHAVLVLPGFN